MKIRTATDEDVERILAAGHLSDQQRLERLERLRPLIATETRTMWYCLSMIAHICVTYLGKYGRAIEAIEVLCRHPDAEDFAAGSALSALELLGVVNPAARQELIARIGPLTRTWQTKYRKAWTKQTSR